MLGRMWTYEHGNFTVHQIPALSDNFIYLIATDKVLACIDPAEDGPVVAACKTLGRPLTHILNTHHHHDHVGGNLALKARYTCTIIGAAHDMARIPGIDHGVSEGDAPELSGLNVAVLDIPGHTSGHIAFVFGEENDAVEDDAALFCGDTLFGAGCGRLFEGTPEQMWHSLQKIMALDPETRFYCAHEYTLNNLEFCLSEISQADVIRKYHAWCEKQSSDGKPTIPGTLAREIACNPMLLPARTCFRKTYAGDHGIGDDDISVFTHIREARNHW